MSNEATAAPVPQPIGLRPRAVFDRLKAIERCQEISAAMLRYAKAEKPTPIEWVEELNHRFSES
jgi:hypothetical protein